MVLLSDFDSIFENQKACQKEGGGYGYCFSVLQTASKHLRKYFQISNNQ